MTTPPQAMPQSFASRFIPPAALSRMKPFYWSVRSELWEHRPVYLAPLGIAAAIVLGSIFALIVLPHTARSAMALDPEHQRDLLARHYNFAAGLIMGVAFVVSIFYSLDALYGERRDRSILFWKSLPVSDLTAVLAKASIPLLVMPVMAFAITVVTEVIMLLMNSTVLLASGLSIATYWDRLQLFRTMFMLLYHLVTAHMLWYAPLYAWLLLISAWARRGPFLWAVLPPVAIGIFEKFAFHTSYFTDFLQDRFGGGSQAVGNMQANFPMDPNMHITPGVFLATPGLWFGLAFAGIFLVLAARLRRYRGPN